MEEKVKTIKKVDKEARSIVFFGCMNDFNTEKKELDGIKLKNVIVWGGCVANCGESVVSKLVHDHSSTLEEIIYFPNRTKGGVMVRPKYWKGDRIGKVRFDKIKKMTIPVRGVSSWMGSSLMPIHWGWEVSKLKELVMIIDFHEIINAQTRFFDFAEGWVNLRIPKEWILVYQDLKSIVIGFGDWKDSEMKTIPWVKIIIPSKSVPWSVIRLLWIAARTPQQESCCFSRLPDDLIKLIISILCHQWDLEITPLKAHFRITDERYNCSPWCQQDVIESSDNQEA